jgi:hypothetical protein
MIGEVLRPHEFDERNLFARFLERSRASNIPMNFTQAERRIVAAVTPELLVPHSRFTGISPDYTEIAAGLVQRVFPTPDLAIYALMYGKTVSSFKYWDHFNSQISPMRDEYQKRNSDYNEFIERMAGHFNCQTDQAPLHALSRPITADDMNFYSGRITELEPIIKNVNEVSEQVKGLAEFSARTIMAQESAWTLPFTDLDIAVLEMMGGKVKEGPRPTVEDLQGVRTYMEDYFADEKNRDRIARIGE